MQTVQVNPSEADKEAPDIARNIDATLKAYGLDGVKLRTTSRRPISKTAVLEGRTPLRRATSGLMDPAVLSPTFQQLAEQNKGYYGFVDTLGNCQPLPAAAVHAA